MAQTWGTSWLGSWGGSWEREAVVSDTIRPPLSFHVIGGLASIDVTEHEASINVQAHNASIDVE